MTRASMPSWQSVHSLAVQSIAIVVQHRPMSRAWAGPVHAFAISEAAPAASGEQGAAAAAAAAQVSTLPDGNHGENISGAPTHD
nr:hypothetical protein [uncultured Rhodoferax sp.]